MSHSSEPVIYQLKILLLSITPTIWRRVLVSGDSTIEDLHYTVQLAMGWENIHLHHFIIHGKYYGITQPGGTIFSDRPCEGVKVAKTLLAKHCLTIKTVIVRIILPNWDAVGDAPLLSARRANVNQKVSAIRFSSVINRLRAF
ncbi:hypothetical protein NIES4101_27190 (plasmid) [Calothrix sp. NIES-4101]|nr:hypothetical protein NIES4101_27190 [Calothrix sp. NIES-4101]